MRANIVLYIFFRLRPVYIQTGPCLLHMLAHSEINLRIQPFVTKPQPPKRQGVPARLVQALPATQALDVHHLRKIATGQIPKIAKGQL